MMNYRKVFTRRRIFVFSLILGMCIFIGNHFIKIKTLEKNVFETDNHAEKDVLVYKNDKYAKYKSYPLFQSNEPVDFPVTNGTRRIPHIIHQICDSELVLALFTEPMRSFIDNNPTWEYRFWTYESGRSFLERHYPYLVEIYDAFGINDVRKSDLLRFAVIHEFGGIYADLDVINFRSLDRATIKYACIVPTEPFEHSSVYGLDALLSTAVLLCRPRHPFFTQLLLDLQIAEPTGDPVQTTGPWYITQIFLAYNGITIEDLRKTKTENSSNSPYFYKGTRLEEDNDAVYIPNSQYFMDHVDILFFKDGELKCCNDSWRSHRIDLISRACNEFDSRRSLREKKPYTFTYHYWFHMWTLSKEYINNQEKRHIKNMIPNCILYKR